MRRRMSLRSHAERDEELLKRNAPKVLRAILSSSANPDKAITGRRNPSTLFRSQLLHQPKALLRWTHEYVPLSAEFPNLRLCLNSEKFRSARTSFRVIWPDGLITRLPEFAKHSADNQMA